MNTLQAIAARRSIRKYKDTPVPRETIGQIVQAGLQAPSAGNRQPWHFFVVMGEKRREMAEVMRGALRRKQAQGLDTGGGEWAADLFEHLPATIVIFYPDSLKNTPEHDLTVPDVQSIGAAIQNMLLAAQDLGLGTVWLREVLRADAELRAWFGREDQMIAAVVVGHADEAPEARPRKSMAEATTWLE